MQSGSSLPLSQQPAVCLYPKPDQSSPNLSLPLLEDPFYIRSSPRRGHEGPDRE